MPNYQELNVLDELKLMGFSCVPTTTVTVPLITFLIYGAVSLSIKIINKIFV